MEKRGTDSLDDEADEEPLLKDDLAMILQSAGCKEAMRVCVKLARRGWRWVMNW